MRTPSETLGIEVDDLYEPPLLVEAGDFAAVTQGWSGRDRELYSLFWNRWSSS
ncbi:lasso RiPP family leader peptide-containing protein [Streptomyces sp. LX-29]|uniref:lasso RiPP family leader peptide-containing protein n=1 Tax=unclassified Streptomyces TaxID=2593676 RepID=UPI0011872C1C|nr:MULTISPECIES: lasso RiPP family leader peptide-containing protein [unclassified Streptomyces]WFB05937.1 lasso RiPP family leader peptide-containing protein [Streptomyces sp. LX-29]